MNAQHHIVSAMLQALTQGEASPLASTLHVNTNRRWILLSELLRHLVPLHPVHVLMGVNPLNESFLWQNVSGSSADVYETEELMHTSIRRTCGRLRRNKHVRVAKH